MSLLIDSSLRAALIADIQSAWPTIEDRVLSGVERKKPSKLPYAVLRLVSCTMSGDSGGASMTDVEQTYVWHIAYRAELPAAENIEDLKSDVANLLIQELMGQPKYAELAYLPLIREVVFDESDDPEEPLFEVFVEFECKTATARIV